LLSSPGAFPSAGLAEELRLTTPADADELFGLSARGVGDFSDQVRRRPEQAKDRGAAADFSRMTIHSTTGALGDGPDAPAERRPASTGAASTRELLLLYAIVLAVLCLDSCLWLLATGGAGPVLVYCIAAFAHVIFLAALGSLWAKHRTATRAADHARVELERTSAALDESSANIYEVICKVAHDLKAPLRGVGYMADYLRGDLEQYMNGPDANPDVRRNIDLLSEQAAQMHAVVDETVERFATADFASATAAAKPPAESGDTALDPPRA
jgi:signal transduction histidine kinase